MPTSRRFFLQEISLLSGVFALNGCGTILYPERRNQATVGLALDLTVIILDGILCLLFVVPGVVAFGVDFATGAIYIPGSHARLQVVPVPTRSPEGYEQAVRQATGKPFQFSDPLLQVFTEAQVVDGEQLKNLSLAKSEPMSRFYLELNENGEVRALRRA